MKWARRKIMLIKWNRNFKQLLKNDLDRHSLQKRIYKLVWNIQPRNNEEMEMFESLIDMYKDESSKLIKHMEDRRSIYKQLNQTE